MNYMTPLAASGGLLLLIVEHHMRLTVRQHGMTVHPGDQEIVQEVGHGNTRRIDHVDQRRHRLLDLLCVHDVDPGHVVIDALNLDGQRVIKSQIVHVVLLVGKNSLF